MNKIHPCCGYPSQLGAKLIAICDLIFGLIGIFWFIYILQSYGLLLNEKSFHTSPDIPNSVQNQVSTTPKFNDWFLSLQTDSKNSTEKNESMVVYNKGTVFAVTNSGIEIYQETANVFLSGFYTLVNLCLSVLLLSAANEESVCLLMMWFAIRLFIIIFKVVIYVVYIIIGVSISTQIPHIFFMIVHLYGLWIVWVFVDEIRVSQRNSNGKVSKESGEINKEYIKTESDDEEPPFDRPQKRKMTIEGFRTKSAAS